MVDLWKTLVAFFTAFHEYNYRPKHSGAQLESYTSLGMQVWFSMMFPSFTTCAVLFPPCFMTLGNFARCSIIPMIPKFSKHLLKVYLVLVLLGWNTFSKGYLEHIRAYCAVRWVPAKFPLVAILRWGQGTTAGKEGPPAKEMHIYLLPMNIYISLSLYNTHATSYYL